MPATRVGLILRYLKFLESEGVCSERLLACAGIPRRLLDYPEALIPRDNAYRFGELACQALGTEHIGIHLLRSTSLGDYGSFGRMLERSLTVYDYLRRAVSHYNSLVTGQHIWLSFEGDEIRLNVETLPDTGLGAYQSHLSTLLLTIVLIRKADPNWAPREMGLAYRAREAFPETGLCPDSRLTWDTRISYITIPRDLLGVRLASRGCGICNLQPTLEVKPIPEELGELVQYQIEALIAGGQLEIDIVAESISMSRRSLQRKLARKGLNFSQLLSDVRLRLAADWLEGSDKPITDIAFDLGYTDSSNFSRAFRWQSGVSPQSYRNNNRDLVAFAE